MPDQLADLIIEEVSGVDHPATLVEGWLVMKRAGDTDVADDASDDLVAGLEAIIADAKAFEKDAASLMTAMEASKTQLADAPDDVKAAANTLYAYLKSMAPAAPAAPATPAAAPAAPNAPAPAPKGYAAARKNFVARAVAKLLGADVDEAPTDNKEDDVTPEEIAEIAKAVAVELAKHDDTTDAATAADETVDAPATDDATTTDAPAADETPDAADAVDEAATDDAPVADDKADELEELKAALDAERAAHAVTRTGVEKALDRIERLERPYKTSKQLTGQETPVDAATTEAPKAKTDAEIFSGISKQAARNGERMDLPSDLL